MARASATSTTPTGNPSTNAANIEAFTYNALGETATTTDRNGNVHAYTRDNLGRVTADAVTSFGGGVSNGIVALNYAFDGAGRLSTLTSIAYGDTTANQIQRQYNGYGQLTAEYQEHGGEVNTSTSPKVQYVYSEGGSGVSDNHSRLTRIVYPNGRILRYEYGSSGGLNDKISRLAFLADDDGGSVGDSIEEYSYLGYSTVVKRNRPSANSQLTYIKQSGESDGDAGDQYTGLDRFGRIVDQRWLTQSGTNASAIDRFQYAYDANSNPLYKKNLLDSTFSELYHANGTNAGYDSLNRLTDFRRGTLSDANSDGVFDTVSTLNTLTGSQKNWNLDAVGNWNSETTDGTSVNRTHDAQNELTAVGSTNLTYDNAGSLTEDQEGRSLVYDAWNRLVSVLDEPEGSAIQSYAYDAAGRRISHSASTATNLYYSANWQLLEERQSGSAKNQYVWSPTYIDELILRDQYGVSTAGTLDTTFGSGGITYTDLGPGNSSDDPYSVAVQADGKIVVAGYFVDNTDTDIAIVRYNVDGSLDTSFDSDGVLLMDLSEYGEAVLGVAIQPDGKIVLAGSIFDGSESDFLLLRLTTDGSLDNSFGGNDDGIVTTDYNASDQFESLALQADGKIVALGSVLARYNSDGSLDTSFDGNGLQPSVSGHAVAIASDGKIVVAGTSGGDFAVARVTTGGSLDTTFDSDGIATADLGNNEVGLGLAIQADDKIVIAGFSDDETNRDFALTRFNTNGSLDTSFDSDGKVLTDFEEGSWEEARAVAIQPDGKIVAAGTHYNDYSEERVFAVARYNSDGSLDSGFGAGGKSAGSIRMNDYGRSVIQADGRIIVAGVSNDEYGDGAFGVAVFRSGLPQRLNVQTDANHNITSIADGFADVKARYVFDPQGKRTVMSANWATTSDAFSMRVGFQGGLMDPVTHNWHFRNRDLNSYLGRWFQADPIGYPDGANRYRAFLAGPVRFLDPFGLAGWDHHPYPLHLGGNVNQPILRVRTEALHQAAHNYFTSKGLGPGDAGREAWKKLSERAQWRHIRRSLQIAEIPDAIACKLKSQILKGARPGRKTPRGPGIGKLIVFSSVVGAIADTWVNPSPAWAAEIPPPDPLDDLDNDGIVNIDDPYPWDPIRGNHNEVEKVFERYHESLEQEVWQFTEPEPVVAVFGRPVLQQLSAPRLEARKICVRDDPTMVDAAFERLQKELRRLHEEDPYAAEDEVPTRRLERPQQWDRLK